MVGEIVFHNTFLVLIFSFLFALDFLFAFSVRVGRKPSKTDSIKSKISSKTYRGKNDSTKRHHDRPATVRSGEQQISI